MNFAVVAGVVASWLFLSGLITQIMRVRKRKMADDISLWCLAKWIGGFTLMLFVSVQTEAHWIFLASYSIQMLACLYLYYLVGRYQHEMTMRMIRMRAKIMAEAKKNVIEGGRK